VNCARIVGRSSRNMRLLSQPIGKRHDMVLHWENHAILSNDHLMGDGPVAALSALMKTTAPGRRSSSVAGAMVTTGVPSGMKTFFSLP
jgi:hypothetical protein